MRRRGNLFTLSFLAAMLIPSALGQSGTVPFKPGAWQITSTVTVDGRTVTSQQRICANNAADFWKQQRADIQCDPPVVTSVPGGVHVQLACQGSNGPVAWKMKSQVTEIFSKDGNSFTASGSTTTTTSYPGHSPMTATGTMESTGAYQGTCAAGK